jgi:hypothetical protein
MDCGREGVQQSLVLCMVDMSISSLPDEAHALCSCLHISPLSYTSVPSISRQKSLKQRRFGTLS